MINRLITEYVTEYEEVSPRFNLIGIVLILLNTKQSICCESHSLTKIFFSILEKICLLQLSAASLPGSKCGESKGRF